MDLTFQAQLKLLIGKLKLLSKKIKRKVFRMGYLVDEKLTSKNEKIID